MQLFENEELRGFGAYDEGKTYSDIDCRKCHILSCSANAKMPETRPTFEHIKLTNCSHRGCGFSGAVLRDVVVENLRGPLLQLWGGAFDQVVLKGRFNQIMFSPAIGLFEDADERRRAFSAANEEFYKNVDWALDISEGEFSNLEFHGGIPGSLIRRDPETQVLVKRENVVDESWRDLPWRDIVCSFQMQGWIKTEEPDIVLAAPKKGKNFKDYLHDVKMLRKAGIAEPD